MDYLIKNGAPRVI
jgi:epsin